MAAHRDSTTRPAELIRAAAVARRYYLQGASKIEIAEEFDISRFKVARVLEDARDSGLVRIDIAVPAQIDAELSDALRARYGLTDAIVVATSEDTTESLRRSVGTVAADYLAEIIVENDVVGLACSRTLQEAAFALTTLPKITVVQLTGVHPGGVKENSVELVRRVASVARGPAAPIYAPLVLPDAAFARGLHAQPQVSDAVRLFPDLTKAIVAIGSWDPPESLLFDSLTKKEATALRKRGCHAETCARLVDEDGVPVTDIDDRIIAITLEQLRKVPEVIAVACGARKTSAIHSVLSAGVITALVTDAEVARALTT